MRRWDWTAHVAQGGWPLPAEDGPGLVGLHSGAESFQPPPFGGGDACVGPLVVSRPAAVHAWPLLFRPAVRLSERALSLLQVPLQLPQQLPQQRPGRPPGARAAGGSAGAAPRPSRPAEEGHRSLRRRSRSRTARGTAVPRAGAAPSSRFARAAGGLSLAGCAGQGGARSRTEALQFLAGRAPKPTLTRRRAARRDGRAADRESVFWGSPCCEK